MKLNIATLVVVTVGWVFFAMQAMRFPWTVPHIVGLAVAAPSFVLFVLARIQLGKAFSVQAKATTLVTTGIYSRIRNPIYVFGGLMILGAIIWVSRPWFLLVYAVLVPAQVYRSRKEGKVLAEKFGAAYQEYKRRTWF
jgi:protein-S-isoprenylcysteine O-methyltransferase Ste14